MPSEPELSLSHHFADLTDPRVERTRLHDLLDIISLSICAVIAGADSWDDIEEYGRAKHDWFKTFLALPNGIPSHDTIARLFARLDPDEFQRGFVRWVEALHEATDRQVVAIDGKTLRRSFDRAKGKSALYMVHAWATANHLLLGQVVVDEKSNETSFLWKPGVFKARFIYHIGEAWRSKMTCLGNNSLTYANPNRPRYPNFPTNGSSNDSPANVTGAPLQCRSVGGL